MSDEVRDAILDEPGKTIRELKARLSAAEDKARSNARSYEDWKAAADERDELRVKLKRAEEVVEVVGLYLTGHKHTSDLIAAFRQYEEGR